MSSINISNSRFVFLDRDGVLNVDRYLTYQLQQFELIGGVVQGLSWLQALGFEFIIITNQAAVSKGWISEEDVTQFNQRLIDELAQHNIKITDLFVCYTQGDDPRHKPNPGMFFEAAKKYDLHLPACYYIGDKVSDILAGYNAGCKTILVETGILDDVDKYPGAPLPDFRVKNLLGAARIIAGELALEQMYLTNNFIAPFNVQICAQLLQE